MALEPPAGCGRNTWPNRVEYALRAIVAIPWAQKTPRMRDSFLAVVGQHGVHEIPMNGKFYWKRTFR